MAAGLGTNFKNYRRILMKVANLYRNKQEIRVYTELLLSLGAVGLFAAFAIRPTILTVLDLNKQIEAKEETIDKLDEKISNLSIAEGLLTREEDRIELLETAIPSNPNPVSYLRQIEGVSQRHELTINKIQVGEVLLLGNGLIVNNQSPVATGSKEMPVQIELSSTSYVPVDGFLSDIESLRQPFYIDSMEINTTDQNEERVILMTIIGRAPFLSNDE